MPTPRFRATRLLNAREQRKRREIPAAKLRLVEDEAIRDIWG